LLKLNYIFKTAFLPCRKIQIATFAASLTLGLKEKRRGYSYCKNNDKFDIVKNLAKPRKAKVLRMPEKWPINILPLLRKENWGVQKVNAGIARSCRLGQLTQRK